MTLCVMNGKQCQCQPDEGTPCNAGTAAQVQEKLHDKMAALRKDAERLDWLRDNLFEHKWNGVVGKGCAVQWEVAPDFRFKQRELTDDSGIMAGNFRRAIDTAMTGK